MKKNYGGIASFFCPQCGNQTFALLGEMHEMKDMIGAECLDCKRKITKQDIFGQSKMESKKIIPISQGKEKNSSSYAQAI